MDILLRMTDSELWMVILCMILIGGELFAFWMRMQERQAGAAQAPDWRIALS